MSEIEESIVSIRMHKLLHLEQDGASETISVKCDFIEGQSHNEVRSTPGLPLFTVTLGFAILSLYGFVAPPVAA